MHEVQHESPPEKGFLGTRPLQDLLFSPSEASLPRKAGSLAGGSLVGQMTSLARGLGPRGGRQTSCEEQIRAGNLDEGVEIKGEDPALRTWVWGFTMRI